MAKNPVVFQNGTLVSNAKVEINGTIYEVEPAEYDGLTPLTATNLNQLQTNLYDYVDEVGAKIFPDGKYAVLSGTITMTDAVGTREISYPTGFNSSNCIVISAMLGNSTNPNVDYAYGDQPDIGGYAMGAIYKVVALRTSDILFRIQNYTSTGSGIFDYKILLIKVD